MDLKEAARDAARPRLLRPGFGQRPCLFSNSRLLLGGRLTTQLRVKGPLTGQSRVNGMLTGETRVNSPLSDQ